MPPPNDSGLTLRPGDIEPFRVVGIDRGVVVGRAQQAQHASPFGIRLAAEVFDVFQRHPAGQLHRGS